MAGKRALITGARKGLGRGIALCLARAGCIAVGIVDIIDDEKTRGLVDLIREAGVDAIFIMADCGNVAQMKQAIGTFAEAGGIDILVNNAIVPHSPPESMQSSPFLETTEEAWDRLTTLGYKGYFFACQAAARHMVAQERGGSLICLSSVHAVNPIADWTVYGSMKAGLERMVKGMAVDLRAHNVRVNAIAPGAMANGLPDVASAIDGPVDPSWYKVDRTGKVVEGCTTEGGSEAFCRAVPAGVAGSPSDVAALVVFLCSDGGRYINGQTIRVDGGMSACSQFW